MGLLRHGEPIRRLEVAVAAQRRQQRRVAVEVRVVDRAPLQAQRTPLALDQLLGQAAADQSRSAQNQLAVAVETALAPRRIQRGHRSFVGVTGATLAVSDLRKMAPVVRKGILRSAQSSGDPELDKAVYDSTEEELRKGWLWGPVAESSLSNTSSVTRRFGVWQGEKCRPIDNFKESCLNATASSEDTIAIHTADCVAAAISYRLHELGEDNPRRVLTAKVLGSQEGNPRVIGRRPSPLCAIS